MTALEFRKSSFSTGDRECVEVALNSPHGVAIRDSKTPDGPTIRIAPHAWGDFGSAVASGHFDR
ncbi:DUF397 domain-containing protein [Streptomyces sp. H27-D2]|uniref:DUF397 domain-containing protein n=1 Tax=Streptomyces sp. H27-D2 TaxID=3046304 RepID=UPI002DBF2173|nr:DUF397 domain-containing protein [Streptomyces sp. H27-D2]MEC4017688.1 DUF397 domain-containing protein [Streptomyces sp. H27-D2]